MRISVYDLSYTASPHTFRTTLLYGHRTNAHVTGCQQWHYQKLPLLITAFIAGCPIEGFGNDRVMPFCPPMPLLSLIICFTTFLLLYKRQFLSTQAYLNVADRSATSNLPQCPAARTRHICHADKSARFVRCATVSSYLIYVSIYL